MTVQELGEYTSVKTVKSLLFIVFKVIVYQVGMAQDDGEGKEITHFKMLIFYRKIQHRRN